MGNGDSLVVRVPDSWSRVRIPEGAAGEFVSPGSIKHNLLTTECINIFLFCFSFVCFLFWFLFVFFSCLFSCLSVFCFCFLFWLGGGGGGLFGFYCLLCSYLFRFVCFVGVCCCCCCSCLFVCLFPVSCFLVDKTHLLSARHFLLCLLLPGGPKHDY